MMYWERQQGGNCRIHSLNAFFGRPQITEQKFAEYCKELDTEKKSGIDAASYDFTDCDQNNIISYIVKRETNYSFFTKSVLKRYVDADELTSSNCFFMFSVDHIWLVRYHENKFFFIDSLSGITQRDDFTDYDFVGIILLFKPLELYYRETAEMRKITADTAEKSYEIICAYLIFCAENSLIIGELETNISICVEILEKAECKISNDKAESIRNKIIQKYREFLPQFADGRYNDFELKLKYLPYIIYGIVFIRDYLIF